MTPAEQLAAIEAADATSNDSIAALRMHAVSASDAAVVALRDDARVSSLELDRSRAAEADPNDSLYPDQWALPKIGWDQVFGTSIGGSATVAILDTGVDGSQPELAGKLVAGTSLLGTSATTDPNGHGTAMAGIVAAGTNNGSGIAGVGYDGVRIMPVTVLGSDGTGRDSDVIEGLVWAADHGADVALMAFSASGYSSALQAAIDYAWSKGVVLVAATGNDGSSSAAFPAGDRGVVGVSNTDQSDTLNASSNYGADTFLAAPGTDILTVVPGGGTTSVTGTSASAAHVAAAAALLRAADGSLSNGVIVGRLARTADAAGTVAQTGNGRLNLARAFSDTSTGSVKPAGAAPVGDGGPFVGPYVAANKKFKITFAGTGTGSVTFSAVTPRRRRVPTTCTATCEQDLDNNATGTITVAATGGSSFAGWSGTWDTSGGGSTTCSAGATTCTFSLGNKAQELTVTFTAAVAAADLDITKGDLPDPIVSGNSLTYTIIVANNGTAAAANTSVADALPAALTGVDIDATGGAFACETSNTFPCALGTLAANASVTITVTGTVTGCANLSNTATASTTTTQSDALDLSATATTTVQCADLDITKGDCLTRSSAATA